MQHVTVSDVRGPSAPLDLPIFTFEDVVVVPINNPEQVACAVQELKNAIKPIFGFDMEWQVRQNHHYEWQGD